MSQDLDLKLDKDKLDVIKYNKNAFVVGNPGTGKTKLIVGKIKSLLENGYKADKILCMTFTLKATDELSGRLISDLGKDFPQVKDVQVKTFHSFAINSVEEYLLENKIKQKLIKEGLQRYLMYKVIKDMNLFNYGDDYTLNLAVLMNQKIGYLRSFGKDVILFNEDNVIKKLYEMYDEKDVKKNEEKVRSFIPYIPKIIELYEMEKKKYGIDYTDMIEHFNSYLNTHKYDFDYVIVDELQDSNEIQAELTFKLSQNGTRLVVGDRKQSIFRFQGASIDTFNKFEKDSKLFTLKTNYRSTDEILRYSSEYLMNKTNSFKDELENFQSGIPGVKPKVIRTENNEYILNKIKEMSDTYGEVAVIARMNWQLAEIAKYLDKLGIPYSMSGSTTSSSNYIKESVINLVDFLITKSLTNVVSVASSPLINIGFNDVITIKDFLSENDNNFEKLRDLYEAKPLMDVYDTFMSNKGGYYALCKVFDEVILPNSLSLGKEQFLTANYLYNALKEYYEEDLISNKNNLMDYLLIASEVYEMSALNSNEKVKLYTVHASKGKEFESVIYLPYERKMGKVKFIEMAFEGIISQKFNVIEDIDYEMYKTDYVAFTRAKKDLVIISSKELFHLEGFSEEIIIDDSTLDKITLEESEMYKRYSKVIELLEKCKYEDAKVEIDNLKEKRPFKLDWLLNYIDVKRNEKKTYSFSHFSPYFDCPRRFTFEKVLELNAFGESTNAQNFGSYVHGLLEKIVKGVNINLNIEDKKTNLAINNYYECEDYLKKKAKCNDFEIVGIEKKLTLDLSEFLGVECEGVILGYVDKIVKCGDKHYIIDYKTSKSADSNKMQLHLYRYLYSLYENVDLENISSYFYYLCLRDNPIIDSPNEFKWEVTSVMNKQFNEKIELIKEGIKEIKFGPPINLLEKNEKSCYFCNHKEMCRRLDWELDN